MNPNQVEPASTGKVVLDLRGVRRIPIEREALMELPESVLLCLFPNGVVLSPQRPLPRAGEDREDSEDVYYVDFDADCLEFVLGFFSTARDDFYGPPGGPRRDLSDAAPPTQHASMQNPLFLKQAIIVLREELEYFAIPPKSTAATLASGSTAVSSPLAGDDVPRTDDAGVPNKALLKLKMDCGTALLSRRSVFTALQRNVNRENNVAEQHLIDMLCMSGFERDDVWGFRSLEPNRCCIASIALVLLKTGIIHPPITAPPAPSLPVTDGTAPSPPPEKPSVQVNSQQLATAQKLLLFWRKPARKCWWDATDLTLDEGTPEARDIKVWARRVWTLELSLI